MKTSLRAIAVVALVAALVLGWDFPHLANAATPGANELVSVDSSGNSANQASRNSSISGDGRYIVFDSYASNLVPSDTNAKQDVFLKDMNTGAVTLISISSGGTQGNDASYSPRISYDGRYVVYESIASNLVASDTNNTSDIFVYDVQNGTATMADTDSSGTYANNHSQHPDISADGRFVVFDSFASNLVSGINPYGKGPQVFIKDMSSGAIKALSLSTSGGTSNSGNYNPRISCDGNIVVFSSKATNLVSGDTNGHDDLFLVSLGWNKDVITDVTLGANGDSSLPDISCNGNVVSFTSLATDIGGGTTNSGKKIYKYDRLSGNTTHISLTPLGGEPSTNSLTDFSSISDDGRYIAFQSDAANMNYGYSAAVLGTNVYVRDTLLGTTELMTITTYGYSAGASERPDISPDGKYVSYGSAADHVPGNTAKGLVVSDTNGYEDIFRTPTNL